MAYAVHVGAGVALVGGKFEPALVVLGRDCEFGD